MDQTGGYHVLCRRGRLFHGEPVFLGQQPSSGTGRIISVEADGNRTRKVTAAFSRSPR
jgi:hypothetical protein